MSFGLPPIPPQLKSIQHYLKTASEHEQRDPVVTYWCMLYALQSGLKIDKKSKESVLVLTTLMDHLEKKKQELKGNEAVTNDVVAQAHLENYALKLFVWADTEDRAAKFNKNVVKAFYTAGMLFDVLTTFGELTDEVVHHRKYAKWKAAYIHNCLKNGETPIAGPMANDEDEDPLGSQGEWSADPPKPGVSFPPDVGSSNPGGSQPSGSMYLDPSFPGAHAPPTTPVGQDLSGMNHSQLPSGLSTTLNYSPPVQVDYNPPPMTGGVQLRPEDFEKAQKYCKWAGSALQYEDAPTAIDNLQKALKLLSTGRDS